jgi:hypothetical protein
VLLLAAEGHGMADSEGHLIPASEWPWTWLRAVSYARRIQSIYEMAQMDDEPERALPPRYLWFRPHEVREWFRERREAKMGRR